VSSAGRHEPNCVYCAFTATRHVDSEYVIETRWEAEEDEDDYYDPDDPDYRTAILSLYALLTIDPYDAIVWGMPEGALVRGPLIKWERARSASGAKALAEADYRLRRSQHGAVSTPTADLSRKNRSGSKLPFDIPPFDIPPTTGIEESRGGDWAWVIINYPLVFEHGLVQQRGRPEGVTSGTAKTKKGAEGRGMATVRRLFKPYHFLFKPASRLVSPQAQPGTDALIGTGLSSLAEVQRREAYTEAVTPLHMHILAAFWGVEPDPPTHIDLVGGAPITALYKMKSPFTLEMEQAYEQQVLVPAQKRAPRPSWGSLAGGDPNEKVRVAVFVTPD